MDLVAYDELHRRFFSAIAVVLVAVASAVVAAAVMLVVRSAPAEQSPGTATRSGSACTAAIHDADRALADAQEIERNTSDHTSVMNDLLARRITTAEAIDRGMPTLIAAAQKSTVFDQDLQDYRAAAARCR